MTLRIGVDLGGTKIEAVGLLGGDVVLRRRVPTPAAAGYEAVVAAVRDLVLGLESELGRTGTVGVGTPGSPSPATGLMRNSNTVCLNGRPLPDDLSNALAREVRIANDADCFTLSEAVDGAARDAAVVFGVIAGTGTGGGVSVERRLLRGPNAVTGEWGHNPLPWPRDDERPGPPCYCGKHGCIETFLSGPGLEADYQRATGRVVAARELPAQEDATPVFERHADRFARALASVINVLDPHVIVLGGGVSNLSHLYDEIPRRWGAYVFSDEVRTKLVQAAHGDSSGVRGAAWLFGGP